MTVETKPEVAIKEIVEENPELVETLSPVEKRVVEAVAE